MQIILVSLVVLALISYTFALQEKSSLSTFESRTCPIKLYNPPESTFTGEKIYANAETFHSLLDVLSDYAKRCHLKLRVKQSFMNERSSLNHLRPTTDRTTLSFQLGEAIEFELVDKMDKVICDRMCMRSEMTSIDRVPDAKCFIRKMEKDSRFEQDRNRPNIFMKRSKSLESVRKLDQRRRQLQNSCKRLRRAKMN